MNVRDFVAQCDNLIRVDRPVSSHLEAAGVIAALDGSPVFFQNVDGWQLLSGFCASREQIASCLGVSERELIARLAQAMRSPLPPELVGEAPCQQVHVDSPDLNELPILKHVSEDGGPYITAGVCLIRDPEYGRNACFHRMMVIDKQAMVVRVVEGRGTHTAWSRSDEDLPIAVAIGCPLQVLIAAAMSPAKGVDEMAIANAIAPTPLVPCRAVPLEIPAEAEIVIEGRLTHRMTAEGPFIDLTETWDKVRQQPILEVDCITHRQNPIYHAILPGLSEHKTIMGLPREPGILNALSTVCDVRDLKLTKGGMSWLHAVVQIRKRHPDDALRAIEATMQAHPSVKMVVVVDDDIDISNPHTLEWAIATRVQAGRDLHIYRDMPSSSLDPSAKQTPGKHATADKVGIDATIPWPESEDSAAIKKHVQAFRRVTYPSVDLQRYLNG